MGIAIPVEYVPAAIAEDAIVTTGGVSMTMFWVSRPIGARGRQSQHCRAAQRVGHAAAIECHGCGRGIIQVGSGLCCRHCVGEGKRRIAAPTRVIGHRAVARVQRQLWRSRFTVTASLKVTAIGIILLVDKISAAIVEDTAVTVADSNVLISITFTPHLAVVRRESEHALLLFTGRLAVRIP